MPALLKIKRFIQNDIWKITFTLDIDSLSEDDKARMQKYGEPEINVGGTVVYYPSATPETEASFELPDKYIKVRSESPYTQSFDSKSPDFSIDTEIKAIAYQSKYVAAYEEAFTALRAEADTFTGEYLVNI